MKKKIHIPLKDLLTDLEVKSWVNDAIGVLTDCKQANSTVEKPIGMWEMDFQSEEYGLLKLDSDAVDLLQDIDCDIANCINFDLVRVYIQVKIGDTAKDVVLAIEVKI